MAIVFADKVKVRSYSTGTAEFTLETTVPGFQSFAAIGAGNECYYGIEDAAGNWEVGRGTYDTDSTQELLFRDTVISSSNSNNLVNFPAGGKSVFVTIPSSVASSIVDNTASDSFSTITVAGQSNVIADSATDTLTLVAGTGIDITTTASTDTITIAADLSAVGQDILPSVDSDGTTGYDLGSPTAKWRELYVANGSIYIGDVKLSNVAGKLVVVKVINPGEENEAEDPDDSDASSEIGGAGVNGLTGNTNFDPEVEGNTKYELDINNDIKLRIYETGDEPNDLGPGISLGRENGGNVGSGVVAIGNNGTGYDSKRGGVYIGYQAGWNDPEDPQGEFAIAIGARAARNFAQDNSITLNATGVALDPTADGLYIKPIREVVENTAKALYYNTTTGEVSYADPTGGGVDSNIWVQTFETATPATDVPQVVSSVEYDANGNIIALASHVNPVDNNTYYSVGKYTTTGIRIWTTRFDDDFYTDGWGLAVDNDGGFVYIAGQTSPELGGSNATLTKISGVDGLVEWSKKYDFGFTSSSSVVDVNAEGDPVMVGFADDESSRYVTTTKIDQTDGSIIWSRGLDGQGDEQAYGMAVGPSNEVVAVGYMSQLGDSSDTEDHMVVVKYNSAGVIQWQRAILFDEGYDSTGADADIDSEGNIYVCGQYETDIAGPVSQLMSIIKFDSMGVKQWSRRIVGNCGAFTSSIVVGADDHLYLSATTFAGTEFSVTDVHLVLAKYEFDGTVAWQRLLDYTPGYSFGAFFFGSDIGGSNLAVKQDYVAVGLGFGSEGLFEGPGSINAAVAQIPASGNVFTVGNWDFKAASFSGTVNSTASDILVDDADKTDYDNIANISTTTVTLEEDSSNFLIGTLFTAPGGDNSLVNGAYTVTLENNGAVTLPAGGTITEGYVTSNPTIQLTPATPDVASQKLVIKGGGNYTASDNGIGLNWYIINPLVNDTVEIYVNSPDNADQTLYWWIYPEGAGIASPESGTVILNGGGSGDFVFTVDSDDYEFTVRVSPESNNYDPATGVETQLFNSSAPTLDADHHLHLTTGNLAETSIFLGTDNHNIRTTVNGGIEITTPNIDSTNVWRFDNAGILTVPGDGIIQSVDNNGRLRSELRLDQGSDITRLSAWSSPNSISFTTSDWTTGTYTNNAGSGAIEFTGAGNIISWLNANNYADRFFFTVNGGPQMESTGWGGGVSDITFNVATPPATNPTTVTSFSIYYQFESRLDIDTDDEEFYILATNNFLRLETRQAGDIQIRSVEDLDIVGDGIVTLRNNSATNGIQIRTDDGDHSWNFGVDGGLTLPGDIRSETSINIDINLSDSTLRRWQFGEDGDLTFPDNTVQTTALVQGEQIFTLDTGAIDYAPTAVDFNLLFVTPAIGYSSADPTSVTLPNGVPGQRLVIFNGSSLATLTVNPGPFGRDISAGVVAEFIYSGFDGLWIPLYGTNSPT